MARILFVSKENKNNEFVSSLSHTFLCLDSTIYIVCDNIVIDVLMMYNLTLSSILQKPNKTPTECTYISLRDEVASAHLECSFTV